MSDHAKKKRINSNTLHILDLPEQIFRKIFLYLDDEAIFSLKNICNTVKDYVNDYVEVDRRFLVLYNNFKGRFAMESMHMIKFATRNPLIYAKMTQSSLPISHPPSPYKTHAFATTIQQYNVVGLYYAHANQVTGQFESTTFYLYLFDTEENEWTRILPNLSEEKRLTAYDSMDFSSHIIWSHIAESDILVFHICHWSESFIQVIHFHVDEDHDQLTYSSSYSFVPEELRSLRDFFLGQRDEGEIILFGGFSEDDLSDSGEQACSNNCVWYGTLSVDGSDVIWKATNHVLPDIKLGLKIVFYFNDNVYIVEELYHRKDPKSLETYTGTTCHKYSLKDKKYYENVFRFPKSWYLLSGCHGNLVSIDKHNNFSLIVAGNILNRKKWFNGEGKYNNDNRKQLLFFTEQEGFQETRRFRSKERAARTEQIHTKNSIVFAPDTL